MQYNHYLLVCSQSGCAQKRSKDLFLALHKEAEAQGIKDSVQIVKTGCFGICQQGPVVKILPEDKVLVRVTPEDAGRIIREAVIQGKTIPDLEYTRPEKTQPGMETYRKQLRIVLRNCGVIDPSKIDDYIARDGYTGLERALFDMKSTDVIEELKASGLRGRGGAGFPAWLKWKLTADAEDKTRYVVCNADEGDPGAYMNRSTIEGDPHAIVEAMTICGYAVDAREGFIYIRAEYPLAIERLRVAIQQAREYGLLGENILGTGFSFDIDIRLGAGAFVCGEETALLQSLEGKRGMPVPKPPYPAVSGLWKKPTVINNVETFANVSAIMAKGAQWFARIGTEKSRGTKTFALTGKINNSGLVEVPMGTTLREIIYDIGGGIKDHKAFKGVQTGGPSGGIITEESLDQPITYENLSALGSMMGSGGMIIMDEDDCVVDISKFYMAFCVDESCGKCAPCRIGTSQMHDILQRITKGSGSIEDLNKLEVIGKAMTKASLCMLGGSAANPTLSTLKHFRSEYVEHIVEHRCKSGKCKDLVVYSIDKENCIGCGACARRCPVACIAGNKKEIHVIDTVKCIKCGACYEACKFNAVVRN